MFAYDHRGVDYTKPRVLYAPCGHRINLPSSDDPRIEPISTLKNGAILNTQDCPRCQELDLLSNEFIDPMKLRELLLLHGFESIKELKKLIGREVEITWELFELHTRRTTGCEEIGLGQIATFYVFGEEGNQELGVILADGGYCAWSNMKLRKRGWRKALLSFICHFGSRIR